MKQKVLVNSEKLYRSSSPITRFGTKNLKNLTQDLLNTMNYHNGLGLSAIQIGRAQQVFVMRPDCVFVNPKMVNHSELTNIDVEGCLSIPHYIADVERWQGIEITWRNENGIRYQKGFFDLDARIIQHELDHLVGLLISETGKNLRRSSSSIRMLK